MRIALMIAFLCNVGLALWSLAILPDRVAVHFGIGGQPDDWASKQTFCILMIAVDVVMFVCFYFTPRLIDKVPVRWINLPNKQYWLTAERRELTRQKVSNAMAQFGVATFGLLLIASALTLRANLSETFQLDEALFLTALAVFLIYTIAWVILFYKSFRVPNPQ